jgi:hypothetical protein
VTLEQLQIIGGAFAALVALIGGPAAVRRSLAWLAGYRERREKAREELELAKQRAREQIELAQATGDKTIAQGLLARMAAQDERIAAAERQRQEERTRDRDECRKELAKQASDCDEKTEAKVATVRAVLERDIAEARRLVAVVARRTKELYGEDADTTGAHELAAIEERASRPVRRVPALLPPPKRRRESQDD